MTVKVLHFITELSSGGAQSALLHLLSTLDRTQFAPTVVCLYNGDAAVAQQIRALGIDVTDLGMRSKWRWDAFYRLFALIRREEPTILHTWLFHANFPGRLVGRLCKVPIIICSERTMAMESEWRYRLNRWTIGLVDRVIAVSANVRTFCIEHIGLPAEKVTVIYNGVMTDQPPALSRTQARACLKIDREIDDAQFVLGAVSRLAPVKGMHVLVEALRSLDDAILVVAGDGAEQARLQQLAAALGVDQRIHWLGYRADAARLLPAFDLFVQPSLHEGMPNAVLEAMAAGLPVVATAVGGTTEVVQDAVTGFLVRADDPSALAAAIQPLQTNAGLRQQLGQAGRLRVEQHFSVNAMVQQTATLYRQLLDGKGL